MSKEYKNTGRTALVNGKPVRIYETYIETGVFAGATYEVLETELPTPPIVCERCRMGPHHDGFPPILDASEAIDLGWSRTATGLLDEECAGEIAANDYPREGVW